VGGFVHYATSMLKKQDITQLKKRIKYDNDLQIHRY
jgi:hypothetical protein